MSAPAHDEIHVQIAGGGNVTIGKAPYQAAVETSAESVFMCNGVILNANWVLTTAECLSGMKPEAVQVRVGSAVLGQGGQVLAATALHAHDGYDLSTKTHNVGLISFGAAIQESPSVRYAKLVAAGKAPKGGEKLIVSAWGKQSMGPFDWPRLLALTVSVVPRALCDGVYQAANNLAVDDTMLCAAGKEWAGVCDDDEGGPLVDDDGTVVGIVSWGTAGCGYPGYPGVYTNLANKDINSWVRTYVQ